MTNPSNDTKMVQDPARSKMVQPKPATVWIRAMRPIILSDKRTLSENQVAEVDQKTAKEFCDKKFSNAYPYSGERQQAAPDAAKGQIVRAIRITAEEAKESMAITEDAEDTQASA